MTPSASATLTAKISQHTDSNTTYLSTGALWEPSDQSAIPDSNILYFKYWYLPSEYVGTLYDYVSLSNFLDYQTMLVNGTLSATQVALKIFANSDEATLAKAAGIIAKVAKVLVSVDFKQSVLDDIRNCGGYNSTSEKYSKGVLLIEFMSNGITFYEIQTWNGGTMHGPAGWTGTWVPNEN